MCSKGFIGGLFWGWLTSEGLNIGRYFASQVNADSSKAEPYNCSIKH